MADLVDRLRDPNQEVRHAACVSLLDPAAIDVEVMRALVERLFDTGSGWISVSDHLGGFEDAPDPIASVAASAVARHANEHRTVIDAALRDGSSALRSALVAALPVAPPWTDLMAWAADADARVRLAAIGRLVEIAGSVVTEWSGSPRANVSDAEKSRVGPVYRALVEALLDPDADVVIRAFRGSPGERSDGNRSEGLSICYALAADEIARERPDFVTRLAARLGDPYYILAGNIAAALGWFAHRTDVADALGTAAIDRASQRGFVESAAASLVRLGPILSEPVFTRLIETFAAGMFRGPLDPPDSLLVALAAYGPRAGSAAPQMLDHLERIASHGGELVQRVAKIARGIGALGDAAWALREQLFTHLRGDNDHLAAAAALVLGELRDHADEIVPAFAEALRRPRTQRTRGVLMAASRIGPSGRALVPDVVRHLEPGAKRVFAMPPIPQPSDHYRAACDFAASLAPDARELVPPLLRLLTDTNGALWSIRALERFAPIPDEFAPLARDVQRTLRGDDYSRLARMLERGDSSSR